MGKDSGISSARVYRWQDYDGVFWIGPDRPEGKWILQVFAHTEVDWGGVAQDMGRAFECTLAIDALIVDIGTGEILTPEGFAAAELAYGVLDDGLNGLSDGRVNLPDIPPLPPIPNVLQWISMSRFFLP